MLIILLSSFFIIGLGRQISSALQASARLDQSASEASKLQDKNRLLRQQLEQVEDYSFVEEISRNKLNMVKPGETVVVIPDEVIKRVLSANTKAEEVKLPNWQGWLRLFFH